MFIEFVYGNISLCKLHYVLYMYMYMHADVYQMYKCTLFLVYEEEGDGSVITVELLTDNALVNNDGKIDAVVLGSLRVSPDTSWVTMDTKICDIFKVYTILVLGIITTQMLCLFCIHEMLYTMPTHHFYLLTTAFLLLQNIQLHIYVMTGCFLPKEDVPML